LGAACMSRPIRLNLFEVALVAVLAIVATRDVVLRQAYRYGGASLVEPPLLAAMEQRFGAKRYSMGLEEWFVRDFFDDRRNGAFVDVGSWDPVKGSNTYRLERDLGWSGVAIDALEEFRDAYRRHRSRSRFVVAFVAEADGGTATLHVPAGLTEVASGKQGFSEVFEHGAQAREVTRRTLDSVLAEVPLHAIDFLSMDIELGEPAALAGFTIERFRPRLVCIEAHAETRQAILDYFAAHGYVLVGKYLPYDRANLYFMPATTS
jgi:Methyltransferase FkbM domain